MSESVTPASTSGIGARLRAGREKLGLNPIQLAARLHVEPRIIDALERDDLAALGAAVYARGHIRRYAELVGENGAELVENYTTRTAPPPPDLRQIPQAERPQADPQEFLRPLAIAAGAVVFALVVWWVLTRAPSAPIEPVSASADVDDAGASSLALPTNAAVDATAPAARPAGASKPLAPAAGSPLAAANAAAKKSVPVASLSSAVTTAATEKPATAATPAVTSEPPPAPAPARDGSKGTTVQLRFSADSWVEVYDAKGERLFYDVGSANSVQSVSGTPPLRVVLGHAPGVEVSVNGRAARIPSAAISDEGAQFTVGRNGRLTANR